MSDGSAKELIDRINNIDMHQLSSLADEVELLLNPSISKTLRSQIEATGVQLEFPEDFDGISLLIEQALEYNDPGLAEILSDLD